MTAKTEVRTTGAPTPLSFFSQGVLKNGYLSISGQGPQDPATSEYLYPDDLAAQTVRTFDNIKAIAEAAGATFDDIVSIRVFLTKRSDFAAMNVVYEQYMRDNITSGVYPTRTTIFVELPHPAMLIEVDAVGIVTA
jgi:2-iminobutanoate/2-iminopropanoate deaminase